MSQQNIDFHEPVAAIVVAAGLGIRLGAGFPKALVEIAGETIVRRAVMGIMAAGITEVIVVVHPDFSSEFNLALAGLAVEIVPGGAERQDSVAAGLAAISKATKQVLIHDAARALTPVPMIRRVMQALNDGAKSVIPAIAVVDSLREVTSTKSWSVPRNNFRAVQTPQGFDVETLKQAHLELKKQNKTVTDDASACELLGVQSHLVAGDALAFKITEPLDMVLAEALIANLKV